MTDDDDAQSRSGTAEERREARRGGGSRQRQRQIQDEIAEQYGVDRDEVRVRGTQQGIERELTEAGATTAAETTRERFAESDFVEPDDVDVDVQRQGARVDARIPEDRQQTVAERAREELTDSPVVTEQDVDVEVGERGVEEGGLTEEGEERVEQRQEALEQITEADIEPTGRGLAIDTPDAEILRQLSQMGDTPGEILDDPRTFSTNAPGLGDAAGYNISVYRSESRRDSVGGISFEDRSEVRDVLEAAAELPDRTLAELDDDPLFAGTGDIARYRAERRGRRQAREQAREAFDDIDDIDPAGIDATAEGEIIVQDEEGRTRTGDDIQAAAEGAAELEREHSRVDVPDADGSAAARTEPDIDVGVEDVEQELRDRVEDDVERIRVRERGDGLVGAATTEAGETQVVGVGVDDETTRAFAEDIQESRRDRQRRNVAEQFDEDLGGVDVDEDDLVEEEDEEDGEITLGLGEDVQQEAAVAQAADEFEQFDEDDLETFEEDDGDLGVRPEASAVREQAREEAADEFGTGVGPDDVELREEDGELVAEAEVQTAEPQTREERVLDTVTGGFTREVRDLQTDTPTEEDVLPDIREGLEPDIDVDDADQDRDVVDEIFSGRTGGIAAAGGAAVATPEPVSTTGGAVALGALTVGAIAADTARRAGVFERSELDPAEQRQVEEVGLGAVAPESEIDVADPQTTAELEVGDTRTTELEPTDVTDRSELGVARDGDTTADRQPVDDTVVPGEYPLPGRDIARDPAQDRPERVDPSDVLGDVQAATSVTIGDTVGDAVDGEQFRRERTGVGTMDEIMDEVQRDIDEPVRRDRGGAFRPEREFPTGAGAVVGRETARVGEAQRPGIETGQDQFTGAAAGQPPAQPMTGAFERQQQAQRPRVFERTGVTSGSDIATGPRTGVEPETGLGVDTGLGTDIATEPMSTQMTGQQMRMGQAQQATAEPTATQNVFEQAQPAETAMPPTQQFQPRRRLPRLGINLPATEIEEEQEEFTADDETFGTGFQDADDAFSGSVFDDDFEFDGDGFGR
ncbi:uncharacterized protein NP_7046A (plasmid) [Natronomonas pharaonis DSM 2160]|uniref:Uncharacterized protein n=1 Tax=Natronomonas pharaonis (strain ATCC 35678 / DSM 2160 / CIP 103997 / JCM 8858 / NBRC 14720 / NCIMB 2260 / Gabara) TaxID=348780 RepID=Q3ILT1_NATPD|nr:hypothetical protein [Natronomonas pharaonis]CAI49752.1 uncharacterized protein NP_3322A [Natronomonas pharaonis DSM 2160]CAI50939.1 uncharacterized protein NP_7046A [Natronomonas pharaonis DSM 2160]